MLLSMDPRDRDLLMRDCDEFARRHPDLASYVEIRKGIYRLDRLEGLQASARVHLMEATARATDGLGDHLAKAAASAANAVADTMGFGRSFYSYNDAVIRRLVGTRWVDGTTFSEKVWGSADRVAAYVANDLAIAFARGDSYDRIARDLRHRFRDVPLSNVMRLVQTEGTYVAREAQAYEMERDGLDEYSIETMGDGHVCPSCMGAARQTYRLADRQPGQNFPPLHPRCRCVVNPAVTDWDAWLARQADRERARLAAERMGAGARKAMDTDAFGGSFGPSLDEAREAYAAVRGRRDVERVIRERTGMAVDVDQAIASMPGAVRGSVLAAVERGASFVGGEARRLRLVGSRALGEGELAEMSRRQNGDGTMYLDLAKLDGKTRDEVEQVVFHEMAHSAEWRFSTPERWELEEGRRVAWSSGVAPYLLQSEASKELLDALKKAGISARYLESKGKIVFGSKGAKLVDSISSYALSGADDGMQDSELIAEALRYVAVNGTGKNKVADAIYGRFADGSD